MGSLVAPRLRQEVATDEVREADRSRASATRVWAAVVERGHDAQTDRLTENAVYSVVGEREYCMGLPAPLLRIAVPLGKDRLARGR